jgi:hypothetical protein
MVGERVERARRVRCSRSSRMSNGTSTRRRTAGLTSSSVIEAGDGVGTHAATLRRSISAAQFHGKSSPSLDGVSIPSFA